VPYVRSMEYDQYDNPAAYYLVWRDKNNIARGVSRLYPTDRPYMLKDVFSYLVDKIELPSTHTVWEGSRFCVDQSLPPEQRKRVIQEIMLAYLEFGLKMGIKRFIGIMLPAYWRNIFISNGWDVDFLGDAKVVDEKHRVRSGWVEVSETNLKKVRERTGILTPVAIFGTEKRQKAAA